MMIRKKIILGSFLILFLNLFLVQSVLAIEDYRVVVFYDYANSKDSEVRGLNNWIDAMNQKYPLAKYNPRFDISGCSYSKVNNLIDVDNLFCTGLTKHNERLGNKNVYYTYLISNTDGSEKSVYLDVNKFILGFPVVLVIDNSFSRASVVRYYHLTSDISLQLKLIEYDIFFKCNNDSVCRDEIKNCGFGCIEGRCARVRADWLLKPYPDCSNKTIDVDVDDEGLEEIRINASEQSTSHCPVQPPFDSSGNDKCTGVCTEKNNAAYLGVGNYGGFEKSINGHLMESVYAQSTGITTFDLTGINISSINSAKVCYFVQSPGQGELYLFYPPWSADSCTITPLLENIDEKISEPFEINYRLRQNDLICFDIAKTKLPYIYLNKKAKFTLGIKGTDENGNAPSTSLYGINPPHSPYMLITGKRECIPQCFGKQCGSDSCGGSCGECSGDEFCSDGQCISNETCSFDSECRELHQSCDWSCSGGQCINFGLVEMTSFPECEPIFGSCTDSDLDDEHLDGINFNVQGNSVNSEFSEGLSDYCWSDIDEDGNAIAANSGDYVTEFYCSEGNIFAEAFECENGCENGACLLVPRENACENEGGYCTDYEDSIGTLFIDENGELQFIPNTAQDVCGEGKVLIQDIDLGCPIEKPSCCFPVPDEDSCYDSDIDEEHENGINELLSGSVTFNNKVSEDVCTRTLFETIFGLKSTKVFENYCFENEPENVVIDCDEGFECRDARCCYVKTCEKDYAGICADNLDDGCGETIDCSDKCPEGQSCNEDSFCSVGDCIPKTCSLDYSGQCGSNLDDGCGSIIDCSDNCFFGQSCNEDFLCSVGDCIPQCSEKECGDDGCGGICGTCEQGECNSQGQCVVSSRECVPETCEELGKFCGSADDGCGNTLNCGTCSSGKCNEEGLCVSSCERKTCLGDYANQCGSNLSDGCGSIIDCSDECPSGKICSNGICIVSQTSCKTCGDYANQCGNHLSDNCGGFLNCSNNCPEGKNCNFQGQCVFAFVCVPQCSGKVCGNDSCGGSCGSCPAGKTCSDSGQCLSGCLPKTCEELGRRCGPIDNGCGTTIDCGTCPALNDSCKSNVCVSGRCEIQVKANREPCNDGDICRSGKVCINGNCIGGTTIVPLPTGCSCTNSNFNLCPSPNPANECKKKVCSNGVCGIDNDNGKRCTDSNNKAGTCQNGICICTPQCIDKGLECGDDGCGGSCGECSDDEFCSDDGQCVSLLEPDIYSDFVPDSCTADFECRTRKNPCKVCEDNVCVSTDPNLLEDCVTYDGRDGICCNNGYKVTCVRDLSYCKDVISCFEDSDCNNQICESGYCVEKQCGIKNNLWYRILRFLGLYNDCPNDRECSDFRCVLG